MIPNDKRIAADALEYKAMQLGSDRLREAVLRYLEQRLNFNSRRIG